MAAKPGEGDVDPAVHNQGQQAELPAELIDLDRMTKSGGGRGRMIAIDQSSRNGCDHEPNHCDDPKCRTIARITMLEEQLAQTIAEKNHAITGAQEDCKALVDGLNKIIDGLNKIIDDLRAEKKALETKLQDMKARIAERDGHIAEQGQKIHLLEAREAQRTQIVIARSVAYKSLEKVARHVLDQSEDDAEEYKRLAHIEAAAQSKGGEAMLRWNAILQSAGLKSTDVPAMDGVIKQVKKVGVLESHYYCGHMEQECGYGECKITPDQLHANVAAHFKKESKVLGKVVSLLDQANQVLGIATLLE